MSATGHTNNDLAAESAGSGGPAESAVVVVGLDGSAASWDAFWWGCGEAARLHGRVIAVYVSRALATTAAVTAAPSLGVCCDYQALRETAIEQATELRAEAHRQVSGQPITLSFIHAWGDPVDELVRISRTVHANLIAVGRSTKLRHRVAGSLGRRLIAKQRAPLVVVVP
jgi:hypothetical protein